MIDFDLREFLFKEFQGCTNGNCIVNKENKRRMHTNGCCQCVVNASRNQLNILQGKLSKLIKMQEDGEL